MNEWRSDPRVAARLHPDYPDDIQVIVHDGGPRTSANPLEVLWARIVGGGPDGFDAVALNQPKAVSRPQEGERFRFIVADASPFPILVTDEYLRERREWTITPCDECGMSELFDAPSTLMRLCFPDLAPDETVEMFTAFCPLCGGAQVVQANVTAG